MGTYPSERDHGASTAGRGTLATVREPAVPLAACALRVDINVLLKHTCLAQEQAVGLLQVECCTTWQLPDRHARLLARDSATLHPAFNYLWSYFVAARSDARPEKREQALRTTPVGTRHRLDGPPGNISECSSPTRVDGSNGGPLRIEEQDRQAIGVERHEDDPSLVRHQCIPDSGPPRTGASTVASVRHTHPQDLRAMDLARCHQPLRVNPNRAAPALPHRPSLSRVTRRAITDVSFGLTELRYPSGEAVNHTRHLRQQSTALYPRRELIQPAALLSSLLTGLEMVLPAWRRLRGHSSSPSRATPKII